MNALWSHGKRVAVFAGVALLLLVGILALRAHGLKGRSRQVAGRLLPEGGTKDPSSVGNPREEAEIAKHLAAAIRIRTVSQQKEDGKGHTEPAPFVEFRGYLDATYPQVTQALQREIVADLSLLYQWQGSEPTLPQVILLAHMDVVPVEPGTESKWQEPPFSGAIVGGHVWGRGAMDDKIGVICQLEALERLLHSGFKPRRTVYLALGHDEEIGGGGAKAIAELLRKRGVKPQVVVDEGLAIARGIVPGVTQPVALLGVAQKGYVSVSIKIQSDGGHSSMPRETTAVGRLGAALAALEKQQMEAQLAGVAREMFEFLGPEMPFGMRLVMGNLDVLGPLVKRQLLAKPSTAALIRTTTAPTLLRGSVKENVLPQVTQAVVNFRIGSFDTIAGVVAHVKKVVHETVGQEGVTIDLYREAAEPSRISPTSAAEFAQVSAALRGVMPDLLVAPSLMLGISDTRHYEGMSDNIYRFRPIRVTSEDLLRFHGTNERVNVSDLGNAVQFYMQMIRALAG